MADPTREQMAQRRIGTLMRRAYADAKAAGTLERTSDGWEVFRLELPIAGMPPWTCARLPDGQFRVNLNHLHQAIAPDRPWEHVEHQAHVIAQRLAADRRGGGGFGHG